MNLLTGILATWRLTNLLHKEDGPFDVFGKLRDLAGVRYDEMSNPVSDSQIGKMLSCFWCTSITASVIVAIFKRRLSLSEILASSAGAILIEELRGKKGGFTV